MDRKIIKLEEFEKYKMIAQLATLHLFDFSAYIEHLKSIANNQKEVAIELYKKCHTDFQQTISHQQQLVSLLIELGYLRQHVEEVVELEEIEYPKVDMPESTITIPKESTKDESSNGKIINLFTGKTE